MTLDESRLLPGMGYRANDGADRPVTNLEMYEYCTRTRRQRMVNIGEMFSGNYLKAADLKGKLVTVTIEELRQELIGDEQAEKWVIHFVGKDRGLVLNKTNANLIALQFGDDADGWIGKTIRLYPRQVDFKGELVWAIRVYHELSKAEEAEEDIPF